MLVEKTGVQIVVLSRELHSAHHNVCPSVVRTRLLTEGTELLENWLYQYGRTDRELAYWLIKYILFRGTRPMASLGPMSNIMHRAVLSQDAIGWREFMEGKVSKEIAAIQDAHCVISPCHMNGTDRIKHFISHLLHISHSQWIVVTSLCMTNCPLSTQTGGCAQGIRLSD
jgi:hypothetical protein